MCCGCRVLPPPLEISTNRKNRNPHKPPAQHLCRSPQCRPHHTCCTLQRLHFTLQCPIMAYLGLATHTLAGLCALWLPSAASSSGQLPEPAKPQPAQTTRPALPQPQVQAPPHMPHTPEAVFDLAVSHGMPRAGQLHTDRALCAVVTECCLLLFWKSLQTVTIVIPTTNHLPSPDAAPSACPTTASERVTGHIC